jgi:hypothetical protein
MVNSYVLFKFKHNYGFNVGAILFFAFQKNIIYKTCTIL